MPLQEFPIAGWKPGDFIYYRTRVEIPDFLKKKKESLVFHSFYIWAQRYELYINSRLVSAGSSGELNVEIPPDFLTSGKPLELAIKVDPGKTTWQGISHYGAVAIGEKKEFVPLQKLLLQAVTERPYWGLLPRLTICLLFCFVFFVYDNRREVLWFIAFVFLNAISLVFLTDYAQWLLPASVNYPSWIPVIEMMSWVALFQYFVSFFSIKLSHPRLIGALFLVPALVVSAVGLFVLPASAGAPLVEKSCAGLLILVHLVGLCFGVKRIRNPLEVSKSKAISYLAMMALCLFGSLGQIFELAGLLTTASLPFESGYGIVLFFVMTFSTVTDLGNTVEQKRKLEAEAKRQAEEIAESQIDRAIARTSMMIAHDLRRPFSILRMLLKSMRRPCSQDQHLVDNLSQRADAAAAQIEGMLQDLLSIRGGKVEKREQVELSGLLRKVTGSFSALPENEKVKIDYFFTSSMQTVGNALQLERLFVNVVQNAFAATGSDGSIWIRGEESEGIYRVIIGNSGSFIPEDQREKVFELFFSENKPTGSGIGLAACKSIAQHHGGNIHCESSEEKGTEFIIVLPHIIGSVAKPSIRAEKRPRVALVDDDIFVQSMWRDSLRDAELIVYSNPEQCLEDLRRPEKKADVYITDFRFDDRNMDGAELARRIRVARPEALIFSSSDSKLQPKLHQGDFDGLLEKRVYSIGELRKQTTKHIWSDPPARVKD